MMAGISGGGQSTRTGSACNGQVGDKPFQHSIFMKKILVILMLLSSALGLRAQGSISDPFFNHGQARSLNSRIIAPLQPVPGFVNQAIAGMRVSNNRNLVRLAHLKDDYGYAVWDQAKTFTATGRETALIPMVRPEGNAITGILVAVKDGATFRYGVMDTETPFPYASAAPGTPGMPSLRDVLALFVVFNHALFGEVDCNLVQALNSLLATNTSRQEAGMAKSCIVIVTGWNECQTIYTGTLDNPHAHSYEVCTPVYNYYFICDDSGGTDDGGGGGDGGDGVDNSGDGGNGNGSRGPGDSGEDDYSPCRWLEAPCADEIKIEEFTLSGCRLVARVSGCDFGRCIIELESHGFIGCGIVDSHAFSWVISSYRCDSWLNYIEIPYPNCPQITNRAGRITYRVLVNFYLAGIPIDNVVFTGNRSPSYHCRDCPS